MPKDGLVVERVPRVGTVIDERYVVGEVLAKGGMGCLVKAEHALLNRTVAIKFLLASSSPVADRRLMDEARAMQALTSEHVARVYDLGAHEGSPYIVMEMLVGSDLGAVVATHGPLSPEEAVDAILEASAALAEAHAVGIIHRDVKPSNLFLAETRSRQLVKLLDFGISKVSHPEEERDLERTAEDSVLGTPHYMSPEQLRNPTRIDERTDVWSLAVTAYHLLTGSHPFPGATAREVTAAIYTDPPVPLASRMTDPPAGLAEVLNAALAKRPEDRTPNVTTFAEALLPFASKRGRDAWELIEALATERPPRPPRRHPLHGPTTTTQDGLASTQGSPRAADASRPDALPARRRGAWLLAGMIVLSVTVWLTAKRPPRAAILSVAASATASTSTTASADSSTEVPPPPPPEAAVSSGPTPVAATPSPPAASRPDRRPPPPRSPPAASVSASASAQTAPSAEPTVDIDGVPIVD